MKLKSIDYISFEDWQDEKRMIEMHITLADDRQVVYSAMETANCVHDEGDVLTAPHTVMEDTKVIITTSLCYDREGTPIEGTKKRPVGISDEFLLGVIDSYYGCDMSDLERINRNL